MFFNNIDFLNLSTLTLIIHAVRCGQIRSRKWTVVAFSRLDRTAHNWYQWTMVRQVQPLANTKYNDMCFILYKLHLSGLSSRDLISNQFTILLTFLSHLYQFLYNDITESKLRHIKINRDENKRWYN